MTTASKWEDSASDLLFDVVALGRYIGPCLSKYAQTTQDKVDYHTYHSGTSVIKAFIANNFIFYDERMCIIKELKGDSLQQARFVMITWWIQNNHQNGQSITLAAESDLPKICPVHSTMRLVLLARQLNQPDDMPIAIYKTKKGKFISGLPSKRYAPTLLWTNSSSIPLIPCRSGLAYCLTRQESCRIISRRGSAG
jgi:hypothetical protein